MGNAFAGAVPHRDTPNLPLGLKQSNRPALVEFYAQWCGSCQRIHPYVEQMVAQSKGKIDWIRVDIDDPKMTRYAKDFHIAGTPTFIVYDGLGHPSFRMERRISASLLRMLVVQAYGGLPSKPLPKSVTPIKRGRAMAGHLSATTSPYTMVRFASSSCKTDWCRQDDAQFRAMAGRLTQKVGKHIQWASLTPEATEDMTYLKTLVSRRKPYRADTGRYYVLLNRQGVPLMRVNQPLSPRVEHSLLTVLQMMLNGERGS